MCSVEKRPGRTTQERWTKLIPCHFLKEQTLLCDTNLQHNRAPDRWPNLYATAKTLGFDTEYRRLLKEFHSRGKLLRAFYYGDHRESGIFLDPSFDDWLDYNGYTVVTKAIKEFIDARGRRR